MGDRLSGQILGALERDTRHRRQKSERERQMLLVPIQNQVTKVLLQLDDPKDALIVTERVARSIREYLAAEASGSVRTS